MPQLPPVTKALILICIGVFCVQQFVPLTALFALWPLQSGGFMPWQLLSYAFLHGDTSHLFFNMLGLWMFGCDLERLWGRNRYLQFMALSLLAAAASQLLVTMLMGSSVPTVGASGALYGLLLAFALMFPRRQFDLVGFLPILFFMVPSQAINLIGIVLYVMLLTNRQAVPIPPMPVAARTMVALFGGIELVLGLFFRTGIAHFAHLGGMLGGFLVLRYWRGQAPFGRRR